MSSQPLLILYIELRGARAGGSIESIEIGCDDQRHSIPRRGEYLFQEDFNQPLVVRGETISVSVVRRRRWRIGSSKQAIEEIKISVQDVLSKLPTRQFHIAHSRLDITLGLSSSSFPASAGTSQGANELRPTTGGLLNECPRFRILVIGQSSIGKSTLINRAFGIEQASAEFFEPGKADIEKELISPQNDRFVLHDSKGFEPADGVNCDDVKLFIEDRKKREQLKDQLHAVWLCFRIPITGHGDRLLEDGAETLLKEGTSVLQNIPTIVVFTKYERLLTHITMQTKADSNTAAQEYIREHCIQPIQNFAKDAKLSYVPVSSSRGYEEGREQLIELTYEKVTETFGSQLGTPSPVSVVTSMAQTTLPHLKIEGSITSVLFTRPCVLT
ncbi:hypothetical protein EDD16DRAFT_1137773 [Pisolithus croceorrhizus]|nr:hypothetical protein EDD16DRAFT_1137773 [Pisolithus croceorrhizus]